MPGGTDSNFRAWGEDTIYVDRGQGGRVWDLDGNEFVDLRMGYGPAILGHADARVDDYVSERMRRVSASASPARTRSPSAELICEMTFCDMARMTVSGTEATMHAIRIARGFTGRDRIVKFEGQYHGVHDYALISVLPADVTDLGDRDEPVRLAWGRGIPEAIKETVIPAVYNDLEGLRRIFEREGEHIAAVIIEPILGNAQGILPQQGFLDGVAGYHPEFGALLIFDEVKTGFRVARGGAAELFGITPDLATYAKAMGNGYPAAAFGGRRDVMGMLPKHVSHGGTYAGNRVAAAAATKVLSILRDTDALDTVARTGLRMQAGSARSSSAGRRTCSRGARDVRGHVHGELPADYRGWAATDHELYDEVAGHVPAGRDARARFARAWFVCEAHAEGDSLDRVVSISFQPLRSTPHQEARCPAAGARPTLGARATSAGQLGARAGGSSTAVPFGRSTPAAALLLALGEARWRRPASPAKLAQRARAPAALDARRPACSRRSFSKRGLAPAGRGIGQSTASGSASSASRAGPSQDVFDLRRHPDARSSERLARLTPARRRRWTRRPRRRLPCMTVAQADGPEPASPSATAPARPTPLHCVASGQGPASPPSPSGRSCGSSGAAWSPHTERTITELEAAPRGAGPDPATRLRDGARRVRAGAQRRGSAPVHDARGNVVAAVDIWGPAFRLTPRRIPELAVQAREAAAAISVRLGGPGPAQGKSVTNGAAAPVTPLPTGVAAAS